MEHHDFKDGGAFAEIHVLQYPLGVGRAESTGGGGLATALTTTGAGRAAPSSNVSTALAVKTFTQEELALPDDDTVEANTARTREALEKKLGAKEQKVRNIRVDRRQQVVMYNPIPGAAPTHTMAVTEAPKDPLEPPKHKVKKVAKDAVGDPIPIVRSPPRKVTKTEKEAANVPPCLSNWNNKRGYIVDLETRVAAGGRGKDIVATNDKFVTFSETLASTERRMAAEVKERARIREEVEERAQDDQEAELERQAQEALMAGRRTRDAERRARRNETDEERLQRLAEEQAMRDREAEIQRQIRRKDKIAQKLGLDPSELQADDMLNAVLPGQQNTENQYDSRLFRGGGAKAAGDAEDGSVVDAPLFQPKGVFRVDKDRVAREMENLPSKKGGDVFGVQNILDGKK